MHRLDFGTIEKYFQGDPSSPVDHQRYLDPTHVQQPKNTTNADSSSGKKKSAPQQYEYHHASRASHSSLRCRADTPLNALTIGNPFWGGTNY